MKIIVITLLALCAIFLALMIWIRPQEEQKQGDGLLHLGRTRAHCKAWDRQLLVVDLSPEMEGKDSRSNRHPQAGIESGQQPEAILQAEVLLLEHQVVESLSGKVNLNLWMDTIAEFVQFSLNPIAVENYADDSVEAFEFLIGEEGIHAYLEIDKEEAGRVSIRVESGHNSIVQGLYRACQSLIFVAYRKGENDALTGMALQSYSPIALGKSRRAGIEAYKGIFPEGAIFHYTYKTGKSYCFLTEIKDAYPRKKQGECSGDLEIDLSRVSLLNERISQLLQEIEK